MSVKNTFIDLQPPEAEGRARAWTDDGSLGSRCSAGDEALSEEKVNELPKPVAKELEMKPIPTPSSSFQIDLDTEAQNTTSFCSIQTDEDAMCSGARNLYGLGTSFAESPSPTDPCFVYRVGRPGPEEYEAPGRSGPAAGPAAELEASFYEEQARNFQEYARQMERAAAKVRMKGEGGTEAGSSAASVPTSGMHMPPVMPMAGVPPMYSPAGMMPPAFWGAGWAPGMMMPPHYGDPYGSCASMWDNQGMNRRDSRKGGNRASRGSESSTAGKTPASAKSDPNATDTTFVEESQRTTIMLRNLPNNYTREMVLEMLDSKGFKGKYNFVYLPIDFHRSASFGYAFVNMLTHEVAEEAKAVFHGFKDWKMQSQKTCEVAWGEPLQGLPAHIERYRDSPVMHPEIPDEFKPMVFIDGDRVEFPKPTKKIRKPRLKQGNLSELGVGDQVGDGPCGDGSQGSERGIGKWWNKMFNPSGA